MGFFNSKSRVKEEAGRVETPKALTVREFKKNQKKKRKGNVSDFSAKKEERSSRIEALMEQRNAFQHGGTVKPRSYSPTNSTSPSQSLKDVSSIGLSTASIATKRQFFGGLFGK
jgi:hypothetical protein